MDTMGLRRVVQLVVALAVVVGLTACQESPRLDEDTEPSHPATGPCEVTPEDGSIEHVVTVDGTERAYRLYVPEDLPTDSRIPVVYLFHGRSQEADAAATYTQFDDAAREHGFLLVAPVGTGDPIGWDHQVPASEAGSDAAFIMALTDAVATRHCADPARQYAVGMSNGAALAFTLACEPDAPFAAYGAVAGATYEPRCAEVPPRSIIYFHGTADVAIPFAGGDTLIGEFEPAEETMQRWSEHDACDPTATYETIGDDISHWQWQCPGAGLEVFVAVGSGHTWPGASQAAGGAVPTTQTISATDEMVRFFGLDG